MVAEQSRRLGVLTSGGDAAGMNAAVRAIVRTALDRGVEVYAIYEGFQGMVEGGTRIRQMNWDSVGGILQRGGTIIGTTRSDVFRSRAGRLRAVGNLLEHGIDNLIVIGGDGSLCGVVLLHQEWPSLVEELVAQGRISAEVAARHPYVTLVGLPGSIDNDIFGTDMTIGADTALHRITQAVDAISSTAASHQRTFVVEVMGRHCGYLALMGALASGADWVLIPSSPPSGDNWEERMCEVLKTGRAAGRRDSIVIVAEGAYDRQGNRLTSGYIRKVLEERLGEDVRVTILGHIQRGGSPSAFDRNLSTMLGYAAVEEIFSAVPGSAPCLIGMRGNRIVRTSLQHCVEQTRAVTAAIAEQDFSKAMALRGSNYQAAFRTLRTLVRALPHAPTPGQKRLRLAVIHSGAPAPGMNTAVRAAVRLGVDQGHIMFGIRNGFQGLIAGDISEMNWMSVNGWAPIGGAELGTNRKIPSGKDFYAIARTFEEQQIQGLLMIGGWSGYEALYQLYRARDNFPAFNIPLICLPATIDNDLPGSELSIGADTALNSIIEAVDKIKQSAVAARRCFVVEVMGRNCGYLAQMSGLATGAERVYLPEEGVTLSNLQADLAMLIDGFQHGKRLSVMIRNENAHPHYTTSFMSTLFAEEGKGLFDVRQAILGHLQQGGNPTPFDRILATRLAATAIEFLIAEAGKASQAAVFIGLQTGQVQFNNLEDLPRLADLTPQRPREQWWLDTRPIAKVLSQPAPRFRARENTEKPS
ncbi:MAG TPA: 6-phosphofructokinase [Candidatus Binatia bacterium]|nr:6-phosphofructokinase [Candidatus Binatia bacterium]